jgi:23S rRNA (uracil1939-C5)-methyltransferase
MTEFSTSLSCPYLGNCPGCQLEKKVTRPPIYEEVINYFNQPIPLHHGELVGWRTRAKLAVRGTSIDPKIGLFHQGTHEVFPLLDCPLHHPSINRAVQLVKQTMLELQIEPYQEKSGRGLLRYLQLVVERNTGKVQLTLVVNTESIHPQLLTLCSALAQKQEWHSLWVNFQPNQTNRIFGDTWQLIHGQEELWEHLAGVDICFHPACFAQAHLNLFEKMLLSIQRMVPTQKRVVEFYAGVGVIGLSLAAQSLQVTCSESNPFAKSCFEKTHQKLLPALQQKVHFETGKAEHLTTLLDQAQVIIVDPPRKGLDATFLHSLDAEQLIYVSCGWDSFKRDHTQLLARGWHLDQVESYLLFPGTNHLELLASFKKCT